MEQELKGKFLRNYRNLVALFFLFFFDFCFSQTSFESFLKPSDSLSTKRRNGVVISETVISASTLIALNELWYSDFPKSKFHIVNDNSEWYQIDKLGHAFSSYQIGRFGADALKWSGSKKRDQLIYGSTLGFVFLSAVEVLDGYSSEWGFSLGDIAANAGGTMLYVSQEIAWKEQRVIPKFSFHTTSYASLRPNVLGSSLKEQILKDYNGQTYWLSGNITSFFKYSKVPKWMNIAVGFGAEGMVTGENSLTNPFLYSDIERKRQFYLSFDVDLTKISTKSQFLKTFFSVINTIKVPAPTLELDSRGVVNFHCLYF